MYRSKLSLVLILITSIQVLAGSSDVKDANSSNISSQKKMPNYVITISNEKLGDQYSTVSSETADANGRIMYFINDNPIAFYTNGGMQNYVNQYIKPGNNTISIKGEYNKPIYMKLRLYENGQFTKTFLDKTIIPQNNKINWEGKFEADISYKLPIFENANKIPTDSLIAKKAILEYLKEFYTNISNYKAKEAAKQAMEGSLLWERIAYGRSQEELDQMYDFGFKNYSDKEISFLPFKEQDVKFVFGPQLVFVYAGFSEDGDPFTFALTKKKRVHYVPAGHLAFINNHWVLWE